MTLLRSFAFLLLTQLVWVTVAGAHHSFSPVYDGKRQVTVVGVVTQFKFANPHDGQFTGVSLAEEWPGAPAMLGSPRQ